MWGRRIAWLLAAFAAACHRNDGPTVVSPVATVSVTADRTEILVGATTRVRAVLRDAAGTVVDDRVPVWASLAPAVLSVTQDGEVTGLQQGVGQVRASSGRALSEVTITVVRRVAAAVTLARDTATLPVPGGAVQAIAAVTDSAGNPIEQPAIVWSSSAPLVAAVNVAGLVTAVASGSAVITGAVDGLSASMAVLVRPVASEAAPVVEAVASALRPGESAVLSGRNFAPTPAGNQVLVEGVAASVLSATPSELTIAMPAAGFVCGPTRDAFVQVSANGLVGGGLAQLQPGFRRDLQPGQSVVVTTPAEVRCNELVPAAGRWIVSIFNASRAQVTPASTGNVLFAVRGIPGAPPGAVVRATQSAMRRVIQPATIRLPPDAGVAAHIAILDRNLALVAAAAPAAKQRADYPARHASIGAAGSIGPLKLPNLDSPDFCVGNTAVGFRTAYLGPHVAIVEDTTSTLNGKPTQRGAVDAYYQRLGDEIEAVAWPIITGNFGNPLAMDARLGGPGRLIIALSPRVRAMQRGSVLAFVANCDLYPASQRPSSNAGAYIYGVTPGSAATGFGTADSRDQWLREMRGTIVHEMKHVAAFAERASRGLPLEDLSWEEGSARIAEELYARTFYLNQRAGDTRFAASIGCDIRFADPGPCFARPVLMLRHFDALYSYFSAPEINTPSGRPFSDDLNFYGGAWSFLRWAADHSSASEAQFFRDFVGSPTAGIANLEVRTGRSWAQMLGEWSLAAYLDNAGGFTPANPRLAMPSWNYPDIWLGMCTEMGPCRDPANPVQTYLRSTPFAPRQRSFGDFLIGYGSLVVGGFTLLDLSGQGGASQAIELKALSGEGDPPPNLYVAFVRVR
ncbi:MAG: hypothetical protein IT356_00795 [Gemmatimonadaceae bacterium]|nr:hypothetical protein [Gemmatimonadaceae bacterium]